MTVRARGRSILVAAFAALVIAVPVTAASAVSGPAAEETGVASTTEPPATGPTGGPGSEPEPTAPGPTNPGPTDPGPTDPGPTDPGPTDPGPTDPGPTGPTDPDPSVPNPTDPIDPTDPTDPTDPADPTDPTDPTDPGPTRAEDDQVRLVAGNSVAVNVLRNDQGVGTPQLRVLDPPDDLRVEVLADGRVSVEAARSHPGGVRTVRYELLADPAVRGLAVVAAATLEVTIVPRADDEGRGDGGDGGDGEGGDGGDTDDRRRGGDRTEADGDGSGSAGSVGEGGSRGGDGGTSGNGGTGGLGGWAGGGYGEGYVQAVNDQASTRRGSKVLVPVLDNDSVPEGTSVTVAVKEQPSHGRASVEGTAIAYRPVDDFVGTDELRYALHRNGKKVATATVRITVLPPLLLAVDDDVVLDDETRRMEIDVLDNDEGVEGDVSLEVVQPPEQGSADIQDHQIVYSVDGGRDGTDTFTYSVTTPEGTDTATVTVHFLGGEGAVAVDDHVVVPAGETTRVDPTTNDYFPPGRERSRYEVTLLDEDGPCRVPDGGTLQIAPDGEDSGSVLTCRYELVGWFSDGDSGWEDVSNEATIHILVQGADAVDDRASAVSDGRSVDIDVLTNDTGLPERATAALTADTSALGADLSVDDGVVTYTPTRGVRGTDRFTYQLVVPGWQSEGARILDTATVLVDVVAPSTAPARFAADEGDQQVRLTWAPPPDSGGSPVLRYVLGARERRDQQVGRVAAAAGPPVTVPATQLEYVWSGLTNGTTYEFSVAAETAAGLGAPAVLEATPYGRPSAPANVEVTPGDRIATVTWEPPADDGGRPVEGYRVSWRPTKGTGATGSQDLDENARSFIVRDLDNGREYAVTVIALNPRAGDPAEDTVIPRTTPGPPQDLSCPPTNGTLACSWAEPESNGGNAVREYVVRWRPAAGAGVATGQKRVTAPTTTVELPGLEPGTLYKISVSAVNEAGEGPAAETTATPRALTLATDSAVTGADAVVLVDVTANDTGVDPDLVVRVLAASGGSAQEVGDRVRVTPAGAAGPVEVTYAVLDGEVPLAEAQLTVHVVDAVDDTASSRRGDPVTVPVLANDSVDGVPGAPLPAGVQREQVGPPVDGTVSDAAPGFGFQPSLLAGGSFEYRLVLDGVELDRATARIGVTGPTVRDDTLTVTALESATVDVVANDGDSDGLTVTVLPAPGPTAGRVERVDARTLRYVSRSARATDDSFRYRLEDARFVYGTATVRVEVLPPRVTDPPTSRPPTSRPPTTPVRPSAPTAVDDVAETAAGRPVSIPVLGNDVAAPGAPFAPDSVTVTAPASGTATAAPDGTVRYVPADDAQDLTDRFTYQVRDDDGRTVSASVAVRVGARSGFGAELLVTAPGMLMTVTGQGCLAGETVVVTVADEPVSGRAGPDGRFAVEVSAPDQVGRHQVEAVCGVNTFRTELDVVQTTSASATPAPAGAAVLAAGMLAFYLLFGSLLAPRGTSSPARRPADDP